MNIRYELKVIDLDAPENNVIIHEYSSDIEDIKEALQGFEYEHGEVISGRSNDDNN